MRFLTVFVVLGALWAAPARADAGRLQWPLHPRPTVLRVFDPPSAKWKRGHRGVDLAATAGQPVYAAADGAVVFSGRLAGRPLVSITHPGGLRTTYEPVEGAVSVGQLVAAGSALGVLVAGHPGCGAPACLHWGALWGPASRADYVDPLGMVVTTEVRLKPLGG